MHVAANGDAMAISLLEERLTNGPNSDVRVAAAKAIGQVAEKGDLKVVELLRAKLNGKATLGFWRVVRWLAWR